MRKTDIVLACEAMGIPEKSPAMFVAFALEWLGREFDEVDLHRHSGEWHVYVFKANPKPPHDECTLASHKVLLKAMTAAVLAVEARAALDPK